MPETAHTTYSTTVTNDDMRLTPAAEAKMAELMADTEEEKEDPILTQKWVFLIDHGHAARR